MDAAHPYALPAGAVIGGFKLVRVLGAGGFGITYEAISPFTGRRWAVKEFYPQGYASRADATRVVYSANAGDIIDRALAQFERSTMKLCELDHPNIVKVIHYIQENATGYMVMDYVEGRTLESWLRDRPSPPALSELRPILDKVFDALDYAHSCNTVHRDIAPDNILVRSDGNPILIDFGALKEVSLQTTARFSSLLVSKRHYSPPEQSQRGSDVRPAMDVYSLAAVLYRAIAGAPPMDADDRARAIAHGQGDPYVPLAPLRDVPLPRATLRAIDRALSFRSADRPQTMRAFRDSLDWGEALDGAAEQTRIRGDERAKPDGAKAGVNRTRTLALGAVAAAVALAGASAYWLAPRMLQNPCSAEQLEAATAGGEAGLGRFLKTCTGAPQTAEAQRRLDARIDEREGALARDAGFDIDKLNAYLKTCTRCTGASDVKTRIALVEQEDKTYRAAVNSLERLQAYLSQCKACLHRDEAVRSANALRQADAQRAKEAERATEAQRAKEAERAKEAARVKADDDAYSAARGSIERLENYLRTCDLCRHRAEAQREADALRKAQAEARAKADDDAYNAARGSIERLENYAQTCGLCRFRDEAVREAARLREVEAQRAKQAARDKAWATCTGQPGVDWDVQIESCTAIAQSPQESPSGRALAYKNRGNAWADKRDFDRAIADYTAAIGLDPKYAPAYTGRGNAWADKRDFDRAIADYTAAIRLDPKYAPAYTGRGNAWADKRDFDRAIADYTEAIRLDPKYALSYAGRGNAWAEKRDFDRAIADFTAAIGLDPKYAFAYAGRGNAWFNKRGFDRAIADYTAAIGLDPKYALAYNNRGAAWFNKRGFDRAIADHTEAIRLDPKYAVAYYNRGLAWGQRRDNKRAIADFRSALALGHADARQELLRLGVKP